VRSAAAGGQNSPPHTFIARRLPAIAAAALAIVVTLTLASPALAAKPVFGIVPQDGALPSTSDLDLMPGAGIGGLRTMVSWAQIERNPGQYDWTQADAIIRETTNRGIEPLVFLYGTPDWAAKLDHRDCVEGDCSVYPPKTKAARNAFGAFAAAAASRYGPGGDFWQAPVIPPATPAIAAPVATLDDEPSDCPLPVPICPPEPSPTPPPPAPPPDPPLPTEPPCGCTTAHPITTWQIWNEENSPKYFAPKVNVPRYAAILNSAAEGIRYVDPTAEIVLGGMWGPHSAREVVTPTKEYLEKLYALGAGASFDSIAIHPYADNARASVDQLESARRVVTKAGDPKVGIWITEIGWAGRGPSDNPYVKGLIGQARVLTRALSQFKRMSRAFNVRGVFWYSWRDKKGGDVICEWCGHAGLRTKAGAEKPAWRAFVRVARS
jgi:hypothetical protein